MERAFSGGENWWECSLLEYQIDALMKGLFFFLPQMHRYLQAGSNECLTVGLGMSYVVPVKVARSCCRVVIRQTDQQLA